jgi:hypothetical protein
MTHWMFLIVISQRFDNFTEKCTKRESTVCATGSTAQPFSRARLIGAIASC